MDQRILVSVCFDIDRVNSYAVVERKHLCSLQRQLTPVFYALFEEIYNESVQASTEKSSSLNDSVKKSGKKLIVCEIQKRLSNADRFAQKARRQLASHLLTSSESSSTANLFLDTLAALFHTLVHLLALADRQIGVAFLTNFDTVAKNRLQSDAVRAACKALIDEIDTDSDIDDVTECSKSEKNNKQKSRPSTQLNREQPPKTLSKSAKIASLEVDYVEKARLHCLGHLQYRIYGCTLETLLQDIYVALSRVFYNNPFLLMQDVGARQFVERQSACFSEIEKAVDCCVYDSAMQMVQKLHTKIAPMLPYIIKMSRNCSERNQKRSVTMINKQCDKSQQSNQYDDSSEQTSTRLAPMTLQSCKTNVASEFDKSGFDEEEEETGAHGQHLQDCEPSKTITNSPVLPLIVTPTPKSSLKLTMDESVLQIPLSHSMALGLQQSLCSSKKNNKKSASRSLA